MPFAPGHKINEGRVKDERAKAAIGQKSGILMKCPYCNMISTRNRISKHISVKHPTELQYKVFSEFYIESLFATPDEYKEWIEFQAANKFLKANFG